MAQVGPGWAAAVMRRAAAPQPRWPGAQCSRRLLAPPLRRSFGHAHGPKRELGAGALPAPPVLAAAAASAKPLLHVVLVNPDIPTNTGSAGRTCLGFGAAMHVVEPLGFELTDSRVKRAGLDYWQHVGCVQHKSWGELVAHLTAPPHCVDPSSFFFVTKFADTSLGDVAFFPPRRADGKNDSDAERAVALVFGSETKGLTAIQDDPAYNAGATVGLPMLNTEVLRSFNLSTSIAIVLWEAFRQLSASLPAIKCNK